MQRLLARVPGVSAALRPPATVCDHFVIEAAIS